MTYDTINFLHETENAIGSTEHHPDDVVFIGSQSGNVVLSYVWREFMDRLDFFYPRDIATPSNRRVPMDLIIRFQDGSYLYRELDSVTNIAEWKYAPATTVLTSRFNFIDRDVFSVKDPKKAYLDKMATKELLDSIEELKKPTKPILSREQCVKVLKYLASEIEPEEEDDGTREPEGHESL